MAIDPVRVGEFHLITASLVAWLAIGLVAILAVVVPERKPNPRTINVETAVTRARAGEPSPPAVAPAGTSVGTEPQLPR